LIETLLITWHRESPPTVMTITRESPCMLFCPGTTSSPADVGMWRRTLCDQWVEEAGTRSWLLLGPNRARGKKDWSYLLNPIYIYTYGLYRNNFYYTLGVKQYKLYTDWFL
jgi:hypothetical protein